MVHMDIISVIYYLTVRPDEATKLPATSEKLETRAVLLQKQSLKETKNSDDRQQAELTLPSPGHNCNLCISYQSSFCLYWALLTGNFVLQIFCDTQRFYNMLLRFLMCATTIPLGRDILLLTVNICSMYASRCTEFIYLRPQDEGKGYLVLKRKK